MSNTLEADVAFLHITAGESRITPPAGVHAQAAPRRAARGRSEDLFCALFDITSTEKTTEGFLNHLVQLAAEVYYGTPGSVTAALRESITAVNDHLLANPVQQGDSPDPSVGHSMIAVLRNNHLYVAQSGAAQAILIRRDQITQMTPDETMRRPLGVGSSPGIRYYHYESLPGDILLMVAGSRSLWSPSTLTGLSGLELARVMDRLTAASAADCTGICLKFVQRAEQQSPKGSVPSSQPASTKPEPSARKTIFSEKKKTRTPFRFGETRIGLQLKQFGLSITRGFSNFMLRMAPGMMETPENTVISPSLLAGTAIVVPVLVVIVAALMYLRQGRGEQFDYYFTQAQSAAQAAQQSPTIPQQRANLVQAIELLDEAEKYGVRKASEDMRADLLTALDEVDLINRLEYTPIIQGGFAPGATIQALAATVTDVYVLDATNQSIYRAWSTGRTYEMDGEFDCLSGKASFPGWTTAVDLVVQPSPGALGTEGIVAVDIDGTLVYCAPGASPASSQLTAPDLGWGRIQAIHVQYENLYVLDPDLNSIWIYDASGGLFTGSPSLYFVEEVPDLSTAIDLAMAQDELYILYKDGSIDRCRRTRETSSEEGTQFRVECVTDLEFQDERAGFPPSSELPDGTPSSMVYSPPPEPSLFFLDQEEGSIFQYSMRLVYQGRYLPEEEWLDPVSTFTLGPLNDLFIAAGDQVYTAPLLQ